MKTRKICSIELNFLENEHGQFGPQLKVKYQKLKEEDVKKAASFVLVVLFNGLFDSLEKAIQDISGREAFEEDPQLRVLSSLILSLEKDILTTGQGILTPKAIQDKFNKMQLLKQVIKGAKQ